MARGKGVRLQRYKDGGVSDAKVFTLKEGLTWKDTSGRTWTVAEADLRDWIGNRAEAGRLPPKGFPKTNRFGVLTGPAGRLISVLEPHPALRQQALLRHEAGLVVHLLRALDPVAEIEVGQPQPAWRGRCGRGS